MSLREAIASQAAGMGDMSLRRDMKNMERDIKLRERQYELQKLANENKAALTSQLVGSTLGMAKGAYGAYQAREHKDSVNRAVGLRNAFSPDAKGEQQYYSSIRKNYGPSVLEDVYFRQRLPEAGSVDAVLQRQGLLSPETSTGTRTWMDDFADLAANLPTFG